MYFKRVIFLNENLGRTFTLSGNDFDIWAWKTEGIVEKDVDQRISTIQKDGKKAGNDDDYCVCMYLFYTLINFRLQKHIKACKKRLSLCLGKF